MDWIVSRTIQDQFDALVRYENSICAKYILTSGEDSGKKVNIVNAGPSIIIDGQMKIYQCQTRPNECLRKTKNDWGRNL